MEHLVMGGSPMPNSRSKIKIDLKSLMLLIDIKQNQILEIRKEIFELKADYASIAKDVDLRKDQSHDVQEIFLRMELFVRTTQRIRERIQEKEQLIKHHQKDIEKFYNLRREILHAN